MITKYICEGCSKEHFNTTDCINCETSHLPIKKCEGTELIPIEVRFVEIFEEINKKEGDFNSALEEFAKILNTAISDEYFGVDWDSEEETLFYTKEMILNKFKQDWT